MVGRFVSHTCICPLSGRLWLRMPHRSISGTLARCQMSKAGWLVAGDDSILTLICMELPVQSFYLTPAHHMRNRLPPLSGNSQRVSGTVRATIDMLFLGHHLMVMSYSLHHIHGLKAIIYLCRTQLATTSGEGGEKGGWVFIGALPSIACPEVLSHLVNVS